MVRALQVGGQITFSSWLIRAIPGNQSPRPRLGFPMPVLPLSLVLLVRCPSSGFGVWSSETGGNFFSALVFLFPGRFISIIPLFFQQNIDYNLLFSSRTLVLIGLFFRTVLFFSSPGSRVFFISSRGHQREDVPHLIPFFFFFFFFFSPILILSLFDRPDLPFHAASCEPGALRLDILSLLPPTSRPALVSASIRGGVSILCLLLFSTSISPTTPYFASLATKIPLFGGSGVTCHFFPLLSTSCYSPSLSPTTVCVTFLTIVDELRSSLWEIFWGLWVELTPFFGPQFFVSLWQEATTAMFANRFPRFPKFFLSFFAGLPSPPVSPSPLEGFSPMGALFLPWGSFRSVL